jgi:hypothetical protein
LFFETLKGGSPSLTFHFLSGSNRPTYTALKERLILLFMFGMPASVAISSFLSFKILEKGGWENMKPDQKQ